MTPYLLAVALIAQTVAFCLIYNKLDERHARIVSDLCQRIQAPETAVAQHVIGEQVPVAHLPFDDDGAWLDHVQQLTGYQIGTDDLG